MNNNELKKLLFPAIAMDIITGYNEYQNPTPPLNTKYKISYLHSNLKNDDEHRKELEEKVREFGINFVLQPQKYQRVDRTASYRLERGWQADEYYNANGTRVANKDIDALINQKVPIIGVTKQYDLRIGLDDRKTLDILLEILRKHTNAYMINKKTGETVTYLKGNERKYKRNKKHAIIDAWEIPFISIETDETADIHGYQYVKRIALKGFDALISTLIDKKWESIIKHPKSGFLYPTFKSYLDYISISGEVSEIKVNRVLANWLNIVDWERLEQARQVLNPKNI